MPIDLVQINFNNTGYVDMTYDAEADEYVYSFPFTASFWRQVWHGGWQISVPSDIRIEATTAQSNTNLIDPNDLEIIHAYLRPANEQLVQSEENRTIILHVEPGKYRFTMTRVGQVSGATTDDVYISKFDTHPTLGLTPTPVTLLGGPFTGDVNQAFELGEEAWLAIKIANTNWSDFDGSLATAVLVKEKEFEQIHHRVTLQLDLTFIYDRSYTDIERAWFLNQQVVTGKATQREYQEWLTDLKGMLNRSDIERNCLNIWLLSLFLGNEINTDTIPELPMPAYYDQFLTWVTTIRNSIAVASTTPEVPSRPLNTIEKWNAIEKILYDVFNIANSMRNAIMYCGEDVYAGNDIAVI